MDVTPSDIKGFWETAPFDVNRLSDREIWTLFYEGDYDVIQSTFGHYKTGDTVGSGGVVTKSFPHGDDYQTPFVSNIHLKRVKAGLCDVSLQITILYRRELWGVDYSEISKDIKTWLLLKMDTAAYPELAKIQRWQNYKENGEWESWQKFRYGSGNDEFLKGFTLSLAQKMMRGQETYSLYYPVATRTTTWLSPSFSDSIGKIITRGPIPRSGWKAHRGEDFFFDTMYTYTKGDKEYPYQWLKIADRMTSNGDSTYTRVEQYQGMESFDEDLYSEYKLQD